MVKHDLTPLRALLAEWLAALPVSADGHPTAAERDALLAALATPDVRPEAVTTSAATLDEEG